MVRSIFKNPIKCWFAFLLILLILSWTISCGRKPLPTQVVVKENTEKTTTQFDSLIEKSKVTIVAPISDTTRQRVPVMSSTGNKNCDSIARLHTDNVLRGLNTRKTSGHISYGFYFDEKRREVVAYMNDNGTTTEDRNVKQSTGKNTEALKTTDVPVFVNVPGESFIPKWIIYVAVAGWFSAFILFLVLRFKR